MATPEISGSVLATNGIVKQDGQNTKAKELVPYQILTAILDFEDRDHESWWHNGAPAFGRLLKWADYSLESQYRHLIFFYRHLASSLGPFSQNQMFWQSNITSTGMPLEFSVNYRRRSNPAVQLSIEPVSYLANTDRDPSKLIETWKFMNKMSRLNIDFDTQLFSYLMNDLTVTKADAKRIQLEKLDGFPLKAQANIGIDFQRGNNVVKSVCSSFM